jgi:Zn-finger nucleic acid-binding protein
VDVCPRCNGLWLDKPQLEKLTSARSASQDPSVPYAFVRPPMEERTAYLPCPACKGLMVRKNFRGISGIIIDWCGDHGAWFDEKELDHVRAFVANGGVDRSQDREIDRTKEELGGLRSRVGELELMEKILHKWETGRVRYRGL